MCRVDGNDFGSWNADVEVTLSYCVLLLHLYCYGSMFL